MPGAAPGRTGPGTPGTARGLGRAHPDHQGTRLVKRYGYDNKTAAEAAAEHVGSCSIWPQMT